MRNTLIFAGATIACAVAAGNIDGTVGKAFVAAAVAAFIATGIFGYRWFQTSGPKT